MDEFLEERHMYSSEFVDSLLQSFNQEIEQVYSLFYNRMEQGQVPNGAANATLQQLSAPDGASGQATIGRTNVATQQIPTQSRSPQQRQPQPLQLQSPANGQQTYIPSSSADSSGAGFAMDQYQFQGLQSERGWQTGSVQQFDQNVTPQAPLAGNSASGAYNLQVKLPQGCVNPFPQRSGIDDRSVQQFLMARKLGGLANAAEDETKSRIQNKQSSDGCPEASSLAGGLDKDLHNILGAADQTGVGSSPSQDKDKSQDNFLTQRMSIEANLKKQQELYSLQGRQWLQRQQELEMLEQGSDRNQNRLKDGENAQSSSAKKRREKDLSQEFQDHTSAVDQRQQALQEKNRRAQRRFRERQKAKVSQLNTQIEQLNTKLSSLKLENSNLTSQNQVLEKVLSMRDEALKVGKISSPQPEQQSSQRVFEANSRALTVDQVKSLTLPQVKQKMQEYVIELGKLLVLPENNQQNVKRIESIVADLCLLVLLMAAQKPCSLKNWAAYSLEQDRDNLTKDQLRETWESVVQGMKLEQQQYLEVFHLRCLFLKRLSDCMAQLKDIHKVLQDSIPVPLVGSQCASFFLKTQESVQVLMENILREHQIIMEFVGTCFKRIFQPIQIARMMVASYPLCPDTMAITHIITVKAHNELKIAGSLDGLGLSDSAIQSLVGPPKPAMVVYGNNSEHGGDKEGFGQEDQCNTKNSCLDSSTMGLPLLSQAGQGVWGQGQQLTEDTAVGGNSTVSGRENGQDSNSRVRRDWQANSETIGDNLNREMSHNTSSVRSGSRISDTVADTKAHI